MKPLLRALSVVTACVLLQAQAPTLPADVDPASYSRLPLLQRGQLDAAGQKVFDSLTGGRPVPSVGPVATTLYSPGSAEPINQLNQYLRKTVVGAHYFQIGALLAAREYDQAYEWSSHELGAQRDGVSQAVIDAIKYNRDLQGLPDKDATAIQFGRDLLHRHKVSSALYAKMVGLFGRQGMLEFTTVIGDYAMMALILDAADQQLPPDRKPLLPVK